MELEAYLKIKKAFILGFDNVLYPEKDYLLQVYYLFAEFINYSEQIDANPIIHFMRTEFELNGPNDIFTKTAERFSIPFKYKENFELLHETARLPLKLLLYKQLLELLQNLVIERKEIYLIIGGNPVQQLNKIKQIEWHGLEKFLKLYFLAEFESADKCLESIIVTNELRATEVLYIDNENKGLSNEINYFSVRKLL